MCIQAYILLLSILPFGQGHKLCSCCPLKIALSYTFIAILLTVCCTHDLDCKRGARVTKLGRSMSFRFIICVANLHYEVYTDHNYGWTSFNLCTPYVTETYKVQHTLIVLKSLMCRLWRVNHFLWRTTCFFLRNLLLESDVQTDGSIIHNIFYLIKTSNCVKQAGFQMCLHA